jgi:hypothetical protein
MQELLINEEPRFVEQKIHVAENAPMLIAGIPKVFNGQADGLQCRTLEILDSFDFGHRAWF